VGIKAEVQPSSKVVTSSYTVVLSLIGQTIPPLDIIVSTSAHIMHSSHFLISMLFGVPLFIATGAEYQCPRANQLSLNLGCKYLGCNCVKLIKGVYGNCMSLTALTGIQQLHLMKDFLMIRHESH
jgi:hypothetical protein